MPSLNQDISQNLNENPSQSNEENKIKFMIQVQKSRAAINEESQPYEKIKEISPDKELSKLVFNEDLVDLEEKDSDEESRRYDTFDIQ